MTFIDVLGVCWVLWTMAGTIAWTFGRWSNEVMFRWATSVVGWIVLIVFVYAWGEARRRVNETRLVVGRGERIG